MSPENDGLQFRLRFWQRLLGGIFQSLDTIVPWHRLPTLLGAVNLAAFRDRLRERNLHHTGYGIAIASPWQPNHQRFRSADGSWNSLERPRMGMAGARFGRNVKLRDAQPETGDALLDPSPRLISNELLRRDAFKPATSLNLLSAAWIQFEVHDWFFHGTPVAEEPFALPLADGDDWPHDDDRRMHIRRSVPDTTPREAWLGATVTFRNAHSHWWDATQLYGKDAAAQAALRSHADGMLQLAADGMLPEDPARPGADMTGFNDNWWVGLSLLHNLFVREHNAICAALQRRYPGWDDEELFQHARLINAALIAKIHTVEWTPAILAHKALDFGMHANWSGVPSRVLRAVLGPDSEVAYGILGGHAEQHSAPYAMTEEFIAVYRMHPLIPDRLEVCSLTASGALRTYDFADIHSQFSRAVVQRHGLAELLYSLGIAHPGAITLRNYPDALRRLQKPGEPLMDLAAIDIIRDRERGVPRYNRFRELLGRHRVRTFEEITSIPGMADKLRTIYRDVDRVDLMVGLLAEDLPHGFGFSDTAFRVFVLMASRRLKSDRFYTDDFRPEIYTELGMDWIRDNTMKSVLLRHVPELAPVLDGINNAFAPWRRVR